MRADERVFVLGEDVAEGGPYTATAGLAEEFGIARVINTPISEAAITGVAIGAAQSGVRPVLEIMFIDFITLALDQLVNGAAKAHFMSGGQLTVPLVLRTQGGAGQRGAAQHSQSLESWLTHVPGLKVVMPSRPVDAAGLLASAIADPNPVVFIENKTLYFRKGEVPEPAPAVPIGEAVTLRAGGDVTIVALSRLVHDALAAAERLAAEYGIEAEVIDPRTLVPLDLDAIVASVRRTGRLVVAHEAVEHGGFGAEIAAQVQAAAFDYLDAPIERVGAPFAPIPFSPPLEDAYLPGVGRDRRGGAGGAAVIAAVTEAVGSMRVRDVREPGEPGAGKVLVRPTAVGICGSDFHFFEGHLSEHAGGSGFPRIQGHEVAATVEAVGPAAARRSQSGQTVALFPLTACGHCYPCLIGRPNVCVNFSLIGIHEDGGLQELLRIADVADLPDRGREPGRRGARRAGLDRDEAGASRPDRRGEHVVVLGAGPIGQSLLVAAQDRGATVLLVDPLEDRLATARALGAETVRWTTAEEVVAHARDWSGGDGPQVVIDATGVPAAVEAAVELVTPGRPGGAGRHVGRLGDACGSAASRRRSSTCSASPAAARGSSQRPSTSPSATPAAWRSS